MGNRRKKIQKIEVFNFPPEKKAGV